MMCLLLLCLSTFCFLFISSRARDILNTTELIKSGDSLVSAGGNFEFGFRSPGNSGRSYVGIWYKKISAKTIVWVANRETPLADSIGVLKLTKQSTLVLLNGTGGIVWSANPTRSTRNPILQLLDSGNLVIRDKDDQDSETYLWQSFDYPGNVQLPGMKLGKNFVTGLDRHLTSWKSSDDPSPGTYTYSIDPHGYPQLFLKKGSHDQYRSGYWNGIGFTGNPKLKPNPIFKLDFVFNDEEVYFAYELVNSSILSIKLLNEDGAMLRVIWNDVTQAWVTYLNPVSDSCDSYALCGPFGRCSVDTSPECRCLLGFVPKVPGDWSAGKWSDGCVRKTNLSCSNRDGFLKYLNTKLPDTRYSWYSTSMTLDECRRKCLQNCSCTAYATLNIKVDRGCLLWYDVLIDIKIFPQPDQDLYVRVSASELGESYRRFWIILSSSIFVVLLLSITTICLLRNRKKIGEQAFSFECIVLTARTRAFEEEGKDRDELELPAFAFSVITHATDDFADANRLGEGGFGPVYKGILGGQEIAVKRLSHDSKQGKKEFKNEVKCIAKLQHRNLVKLLGYCNEADEQLLIYEYLPNRSLDIFILDQKKKMLDWPLRFQILYGVARGLQYLHHDSRLRIIHRDLKASNILLDAEMKPKISDFGLARMFDGNESCARTKRVVGTHGYMSPEYMIDGVFSMKSDVFSFGVLVLEIVSGKRNRRFSHPDHQHNLVGHAWRLFKEGLCFDLVDKSIAFSEDAPQILRSIHVGLLCVQEKTEDRPFMSQVTSMLSGDSALPPPKQPGFYVRRDTAESDFGGSNELDSVGDRESITVISGR